MSADDIRKILGHLENASALCDGLVARNYAQWAMFDDIAKATRSAQEALARKEASVKTSVPRTEEK